MEAKRVKRYEDENCIGLGDTARCLSYTGSAGVLQSVHPNNQKAFGDIAEAEAAVSRCAQEHVDEKWPAP